MHQFTNLNDLLRHKLSVDKPAAATTHGQLVYPTDPSPLQDISTDELVRELLARCEHSNGLFFSPASHLMQLIGYCAAELKSQADCANPEGV